MVTNKSTGFCHDVDTVPHSSFGDQLKDLRFEVEATKSDMAHHEDKVDLKISNVRTDFKAQLQAVEFKVEKGFDKIDARFDKLESNFESNFSKLQSRFESKFNMVDSSIRELHTTMKANTADVLRQQTENENRLIWRLVFIVSHVLIFAIFYVLIVVYRF